MPTFIKDEEEVEEPGADEGGEGEDAAVKSSGIGRVLNDGKPLASGHCQGMLGQEGIDGELRSVDVSPQGVGPTCGGIVVCESFVCIFPSLSITCRRFCTVKNLSEHTSPTLFVTATLVPRNGCIPMYEVF